MKNGSVDLSAKVAFLRRPESYPRHPRNVETVQTHMSWVFLTDDGRPLGEWRGSGLLALAGPEPPGELSGCVLSVAEGHGRFLPLSPSLATPGTIRQPFPGRPSFAVG